MKKILYISSFLLFVFSILVIAGKIRFQDNELNMDKEKLLLIDSIRKLNYHIDSLNDELFNQKVTNGRYELSLLHLIEVNPKAAKEFNNFMEHETE